MRRALLNSLSRKMAEMPDASGFLKAVLSPSLRRPKEPPSLVTPEPAMGMASAARFWRCTTVLVNAAGTLPCTTASGMRPAASRPRRRRSAISARSPSSGLIRAARSRRRRSIVQPLFRPLWYASTTQGSAYQPGEDFVLCIQRMSHVDLHSRVSLSQTEDAALVEEA